MVSVSYTRSNQKPLLTIRDIINANATDRITFNVEHVATRKGNDVKHIIKGTVDIRWQYHYSMETQCCVVIPTEIGFDMFPSAQDMNLSQVSAAKVLNIPVNRIHVSVQRVGGAYGAKISRNCIVSCTAALVAYKQRKPVRMWLPLSTTMNVIGKRYPCYCTYEVACDDNGVIQYLNAEVYSDSGNTSRNDHDLIWPLVQESLLHSYKNDTWNVKNYSARSDTQTAAFCRAPGTAEGSAVTECIMEHMASKLNMDPVRIRYNNLNTPQVIKYLGDLVEWAKVDKRKQEIETFNNANRWVKRGIAVVPVEFRLAYFGYWNALVSIYQGDGSVSLSHGGIEMGQGINTKAAQVCAYSLGIPLDQVSVKPSNSLIAPNVMFTGGSATSEAVCYAILKSCELLKERMQPVKDRMVNPTWRELVQQSYLEDVDLYASFSYHVGRPDVQQYYVYCAICAEVEVDILTGNHQIKRVDILEDTGNSLSPQIDIGQVEGAIVMGMGYWTMESIVFDPNDGRMLTNNTWTYKTPGAKDIPIDFRVKFPRNNPNPVGVLFSKGTAEPPILTCSAITFAIRNAVSYARREVNPNAEKWYLINGPSTVEETFLRSLNDYQQYKL